MSSDPGALRWHLYPTADAVAEHTAQAVIRAAEQTIARAGVFHLVLTGGRTARQVYERLRVSGADWRGWHVYFGDERCLPPQHPERNSRMAFEAWLDQVDFPRQQIHPIPAELGPEAGAAAYAAMLEVVGEFDLVLLSLGEDGHVASLFPGHPWGEGDDAPAALPVTDAPKPPSERVSLSARRLSRTRQLLFLIAGAGKRQAVRRWRTGEALPAAAVMPSSGADVLLERGLFE